MIHNGQAPQTESLHDLLLVGRGRIARNLQFYFQQRNLSFSTWNRDDSRPLVEAAKSAKRILLAVSDSAIPLLAHELAGLNKTIVHFSGALDVPGTLCAHPLMSFTHDLYEPSFYRDIHFAVTGANSLVAVIPGLPNAFTVLTPEQKPLYHALCVLGGNFPVMLWQKMESGLREMGFPQKAMRLYIDRVSENYLQMGDNALTGPLVRKDAATIAKNLESLKDTPWQKVYDSFREATL